MSSDNTDNNNPVEEDPETLFPMTGPRPQSWTLDGYPIVDGRYHDLITHEIKAISFALNS